MNDIRRKYNPIVDLSKFTSNKKILSGIVTLVYKIIKKKKNFKVCYQTLSKICDYLGLIVEPSLLKIQLKKKTNIFLDR